MGAAVEVRTARLLLRSFQPSDRDPFAAMNADAVVMEHFPELKDRAQSDAFVDRIAQCWDERALGLWALERLDTHEFIGFTGLWPAEFDAPFTPAIEVGWRLAAPHWGFGFASEAAREALRHGFGDLHLDEIVSFTPQQNVRSWRVMERIGLLRDVDGDFSHPGVPAGHRLGIHRLYRLSRDHWTARTYT